ncbi:MAG: helix-turn-helix domain-containing protein [Chloroflexi bacterium]|nr:helix-turn-helix domain-containing protein [Chloroflexota bacterium]
MAKQCRIGLQIGSSDDFWVQVGEGIYTRADEVGAVLVPIDIEHPILLVADQQLGLIDSILALELDALVAWDLPPNVAYMLLDHGLPIVHINETTHIQHRLFCSETGLYNCSRTLTEYLLNELSGRGRLLIVGGMRGLAADDGRSKLAAVYDLLHEHPDFKAQHIPCVWNVKEAAEDIAQAMATLTGTFDAVYGLSDPLALLARRIGRSIGLLREDSLVVGVNGDPLALSAILDGHMAATIDTLPTIYGKMAVDLAFQAAQGQPLPPHFVRKSQLVTRDNAAQVAVDKLMSIARLPARLIGVNREREQQQMMQLETSLQINQQISHILDPQHLAHSIADTIRTTYGYDRVQLFMLSDDGTQLILDRPYVPVFIRIPLTEVSILSCAVQENTAVFVPDMAHSHRFEPDPYWPSTRSRVVVPIRLGGSVTGLLDLHSQSIKHHSEQDLNGLRSLADQLGIAIHNADLYSEAMRAKAAAEKADQLKTRLLANVSHDLRTPLNVILGYTQAALAPTNPYGAALPPAHIADLQRIYQSGEHLVRLINDLLDLSRAEIDELDLFPEVIDSHPFLTNVFEGMQSMASAQVEWRLWLPNRLPAIQADPVRLRQILFNLLSNAHKFTTTGTVVLGADVLLPYLHIWVQDTGSGIPVEVQERIFEPFVTVESGDKRREGVGLGLAITRHLVALHGGDISLESTPGLGSTFHIYLPLPSLAGEQVELSNSGKKSLLVIVKESPPQEIVYLGQAQGWELHMLRHEDDLEKVITRTRPAALAWDVSNAGSDDWRLIQRIRSYAPLCRLPFIVYGYQKAENTVSMTNVLLKPLSETALFDALRALHTEENAGCILIVDDDPQARDVYQRIVSSALPSHAVRLAADGAEAIRILQQDTPSLVLLDLMMPTVDGFEVLTYMRQTPQTRLVPVVVISGKMLTFEDVKRLNYTHVTVQTKGILTPAEIEASLLQALTGATSLNPGTSELVKSAVAYIHQNFDRSVSRTEICEVIGVSKNYLSHIFRQELGITLGEYINRYRIEIAKSLLDTTSNSVTFIANQVGFDDPAHFSRVFSKYAGCSPRGYRKQLSGRSESE